jgi:tRNA-dihydrouridine synthase
MTNFWETIKNPIFILAPMEDVTDTVFREIILSISNPDILSILFTEFTSTDGLCHNKGRANVMGRLKISESEKQLLKKNKTKIVAQIWGSNPEKFYKSAQFISELDEFDGIDINMGCPVKKVIQHKSCAALINYPTLANEIIQATKEGSQLPVSVKTRLGFKTLITEEWINSLLEANPAAITIHGRTQKMMSNGSVLWDEIAKAASIRNNKKSLTKIIGNGDILNYSDAMSKVNDYGLNGIMIGRGIFHNPWVFNNSSEETSFSLKIDLLQKHVELFEKNWGTKKNYNVLKRFFKIYISSHKGSASWREELMKTNSTFEALAIIQRINQEI